MRTPPLGVAWVAESQVSEATDALLDDIAEGRSLVVPPLWFLEVANALLVLVRRKRITPQEAAKGRRLLSSLVVVDVESPSGEGLRLQLAMGP